MDKKSFFNEMAAEWDRHFYTPELERRLPDLVSLFRLKSGSRVLDVGAGTGGIIPYLLQAIGSGGSVQAVDFAGEMVKRGKDKFRGEGRVFFQVAAVESLPFPEKLFDHVVCFGAFPHFEDKPCALKEMGRVLKPGGTLLIAHALSSDEIRRHHENCGPVSHDFLPGESEMRTLLETAGFSPRRLVDRPKCYICEAEARGR